MNGEIKQRYNPASMKKESSRLDDLTIFDSLYLMKRNRTTVFKIRPRIDVAIIIAPKGLVALIRKLRSFSQFVLLAIGWLNFSQGMHLLFFKISFLLQASHEKQHSFNLFMIFLSPILHSFDQVDSGGVDEPSYQTIDLLLIYKIGFLVSPFEFQVPIVLYVAPSKFKIEISLS